jgi:hypothetical protein
MTFLSIGKGWFLKAIDYFRVSETKKLISSLTFRRYNGDNTFIHHDLYNKIGFFACIIYEIFLLSAL